MQNAKRGILKQNPYFSATQNLNLLLINLKNILTEKKQKEIKSIPRIIFGAKGSEIELFWAGFIRIGYLLFTLIFEITIIS